jgi:F420H(2)-dependent biliverdin reductase
MTESRLHRLQSERNLWLATLRPTGKPHLVPIWFVWQDEQFYICTGADSVKVRNLHASPQATIALQDGDQPIVAECSAAFIPTPYPQPIVDAFQTKFEWNITSDTAYGALIALRPQRWVMG